MFNSLTQKMVIGFIGGAIRKIQFQKGAVRRKSLGTAGLTHGLQQISTKFGVNFKLVQLLGSN